VAELKRFLHSRSAAFGAFPPLVGRSTNAPFALRETLATKKRGKDIWFRFWTQIGPCRTDKEGERALFKDEDDAKHCSAYVHPLSFYEIVNVGENASGDLNWNRPVEIKPRRRARKAGTS
jgi:hypothetical protein